MPTKYKTKPTPKTRSTRKTQRGRTKKPQPAGKMGTIGKGRLVSKGKARAGSRGTTKRGTQSTRAISKRNKRRTPIVATGPRIVY